MRVRKAVPGWIVAISFFLFSNLGFTQTLAEPSSFLWEVDTPQGRAYLLGSIHMATEELYPLKPVITEAFSKADVLVVEANIPEADPLMVQKKMMEKAMDLQGNLQEDLTPELYRKLTAELMQLGLPVQTFMKFQPWFVAMQLTSMKIMQLGYQPTFGIDYHFLMQAKDNIPIVELEGVLYQIDLISSFSEKEQELFLTHTIEYLDRLDETLDDLLTAWKDGNVRKLEEGLFGDELEKNPEVKVIYQKLFYERNEQMTEKLIPMLREGKTYFVIVGAGHLIGEQGIVEKLKQRGYDVRQL